MIGIGKDDFSAQLFERLVAQALDGRLRAHGHEERRLHGTVRRVQNAAPRARRINALYFKRKIHSLSVSGEDERNSHANRFVDNPNGKHNAECAAQLQLLWIESRESHRDESHDPETE
jgi:hypothetical protein